MRLLSPSINGWIREPKSTIPNTAFVKLPVMTAVEGATGKVKRQAQESKLTAHCGDSDHRGDRGHKSVRIGG